MNVRLKRGLTPAVAAGLVCAVLGAQAEVSPAAAAVCRTPTTLVLEPPKRAFELPGGATVRIWDTGDRKQDILEQRFVAVRIPRGTLIPRAAAAPTLSQKTTPQAQASRDPSAVVVINGAVFDPSGAATPRRSQIIGGAPRKGDSNVDQGLALYEDTRTAEFTMHNLTGQVASVHGTIPLGSLNWQRLSAAGVTAYTRDWGASFHPTGSRTVVLHGGVVTKILTHKKDGKKRPKKGEMFLTAPDGSTYTSALKLLARGDAVSVSTGESGVLPRMAGQPPIGTPDSLIGVSSGIVRRGRNFAPCTSRDNNLRPRSAIAWTADGDLIVAAVSGRSNKNHRRSGGASAYQWGEYLLHLGAVNAVNLDGGSSTTLLVRRQVGGPLRRLDRDPRDSQARVADSLTFLAP
ncbi:MAG TPA: phosphodiester glycosidase family protein [Sporichthya sp.]|nr:phosphodiester glycosidase family protein [Sporichthya sp.]